MAKKQDITIGQNVLFQEDPTHYIVRVRKDVSLGQTNGSKKPGKTPNEMVGSTGAAVNLPGSNAKLVLHIYQPMDVKDVRRERALRELDEEDAEVQAVAKGGEDEDEDAFVDRIAEKILKRLS